MPSVRSPSASGRRIFASAALTTDGALTATVFAFEPLQEVGRLTLTLPGVETRIVVETHHDFWATPGDVLGLRFDPARTHVFDTETGDRLAWAQPRRSRPVATLVAGDQFVLNRLLLDALRAETGDRLAIVEMELNWPTEPFGPVAEVHEAAGTEGNAAGADARHRDRRHRDGAVY